MNVTYLTIFTIVLVLLSGIPLIFAGSMNYASAKYATNTNTQSQGNANECTTGTNCAITSPQTQADGSASSPTNLQITGLPEEQETSTPPNNILQLLVFNTVHCPVGRVCPSPSDFEIKVEAKPFSFLAKFTPNVFPGERSTTVNVEPFPFVGFFNYEVTIKNPPTPEGLSLSQSQSRECAGPDAFFVPQDLKRDPNICFFVNSYSVLS